MRNVHKVMPAHLRNILLIIMVIFLCCAFSAIAMAEVPPVSVTVTDSDLDQVYYYRYWTTTDTISFQVNGLGGPDNGIGQVEAELGQLTGSTFTPISEVYDDEYGDWDLISGTWQAGTSTWDFSYALSDEFDNNQLPLAVQISLYDDLGDPLEGQSFATLLSKSGTPSLNDLVFVNLYLPDNGIEVSPDFRTPDLNLREINKNEALVFSIYETGSITFPQDTENPIDILSLGTNYQAKIDAIYDFLDLSQGFSGSTAFIDAEINTGSSALDFLADREAEIEVYNVDTYFPGLETANLTEVFDLNAFSNTGAAISDADLPSYVDLADLSYSSDYNGTLYLPVNHFTRYTLEQNLSDQELTVGAEKDYATIQEAVDAALPGDTILVYPGTYAENIDIYTANISIQSVQGAANTIVSAAVSGDDVFYVSEPGVTIQGFTVLTDSSDGIYFSSSATSGQILDNIIEPQEGSSCYSAIYVDSVENGVLEISGNTMTDCSTGIDFDDNVDGGTLKVTDNTITDCSDGIYLDGYFGEYKEAEVIVTGNEVNRASSYGIELYDLYQGSVEVSNNTLIDCSDGIYFDELGYEEIETDVQITDNVITAGVDPLVGWSFYDGIYMCCIERVTVISGNEISGYENGIVAYDIGCCGAYPLSFLIEDNDISQCDYGMYLDDVLCCLGGTVTITRNTLTDNTTYGVYLATVGAESGTVDLKGNIFNNNETGLYVSTIYEDDASLNANFNGFLGNTVSFDTGDSFDGIFPDRNWWGTAEGPSSIVEGVGDISADEILYSPWVTAVSFNNETVSMRRRQTNQLVLLASLSTGNPVDVTEYARYISSNEAVATVSDDGIVTAVGAGTAVITANCMGIEPNPTITVKVVASSSGSTTLAPDPVVPVVTDPLVGTVTSTIEGNLSSQGGTVGSTDGFVDLIIPAGAFSGTDGSYQISVIQVDPSYPAATVSQIVSGSLSFITPVADITITGAEWNQSLVARFYYDQDAVANPSNLRVFYWNTETETWVPISLENTRVNAQDEYIEADLYHCTKFVVMEVKAPIEFADVTDEWFAPYVERMTLMGITNGYSEDGSSLFKPNQTITRSEFAVFLANALNLKADQTNSKSFADSSSIPSWALNKVNAAVSNGIISGYEDNTFQPNQEITRAEMAVMIMRALGLTQSDSTVSFADASSIPDWALESVAQAVKAGIVSGKPGNIFDPMGKASRAEAAKMIVNMLEAMATE